MFFICVLIYLCIIVFVLVRALKINVSKDFLYPKKRFGPWSVAFSVWSTGESCWWALGLTGLGYTIGLRAVWFVIGEIIFTIIMWYIIAPRFYRRCEIINASTIGDFFADCFKDHDLILRITATTILFCIVPLYISAQFAGISRTSEYFLSGHSHFIFFFFAALFVFYSIVGGFYVMSNLSVLNGIFMFVGMTIIWIFIIYTLINSNISLESRILNNEFFWGIREQHGFNRIYILKAASQVLAGVGFLGAPNIFAKFLNARNMDAIKSARPIGVLLFALGDIMALSVGVAGRFIIPRLSDGEMVVPALSFQLFPDILVGVVFVGVIAAIFSTADSLLLLISSSFIKDVYQKMLNNKLNQVRDNHVARGLMFLAAIAGLFITFADNRLIFWMVNFVWVIISCTFTPLVVTGCFSSSVDAVAATSSILSGLIVAAIWNMLYAETTGASGIIPGLIVSFLSIIVVYRLRKTNENPA